MEILGIGIPELVFIFIIALLVLGPKDMQKAGRTIGLWLNKFINSTFYLAMRNSTNEIKNLSTNLMREANMELRKTDEQIRREMNINPRYSRYVVNKEENNVIVPTPGEETPEIKPESDSKNNA